PNGISFGFTDRIIIQGPATHYVTCGLWLFKRLDTASRQVTIEAFMPEVSRLLEHGIGARQHHIGDGRAPLYSFVRGVGKYGQGGMVLANNDIPLTYIGLGLLQLCNQPLLRTARAFLLVNLRFNSFRA